jgi:hypothetical protein
MLLSYATKHHTPVSNKVLLFSPSPIHQTLASNYSYFALERQRVGIKIVNNNLYQFVKIQIRSKDSQVKTQLVLWIFILFKVTR